MGNWLYILFGVLWVGACLLIGLYIIGKGMTDRSHFGIGLKTILISYLLGIFLLFTLILHGG